MIQKKNIMDWNNWATLITSTTFLTFLSSVLTSIIGFIKSIKERKEKIDLRKIESDEERIKKQLVIDMINNGAITIKPKKASELISNLLENKKTTNEVIEQIKREKREKNE